MSCMDGGAHNLGSARGARKRRGHTVFTAKNTCIRALFSTFGAVASCNASKWSSPGETLNLSKANHPGAAALKLSQLWEQQQRQSPPPPPPSPPSPPAAKTTWVKRYAFHVYGLSGTWSRRRRCRSLSGCATLCTGCRTCTYTHTHRVERRPWQARRTLCALRTAPCCWGTTFFWLCGSSESSWLHQKSDAISRPYEVTDISPSVPPSAPGVDGARSIMNYYETIISLRSTWGGRDIKSCMHNAEYMSLNLLSLRDWLTYVVWVQVNNFSLALAGRKKNQSPASVYCSGWFVGERRKKKNFRVAQLGGIQVPSKMWQKNTYTRPKMKDEWSVWWRRKWTSVCVRGKYWPFLLSCTKQLQMGGRCQASGGTHSCSRPRCPMQTLDSSAMATWPNPGLLGLFNDLCALQSSLHFVKLSFSWIILCNGTHNFPHPSVSNYCGMKKVKFLTSFHEFLTTLNAANATKRLWRSLFCFSQCFTWSYNSQVPSNSAKAFVRPTNALCCRRRLKANNGRPVWDIAEMRAKNHSRNEFPTISYSWSLPGWVTNFPHRESTVFLLLSHTLNTPETGNSHLVRFQEKFCFAICAAIFCLFFRLKGWDWLQQSWLFWRKSWVGQEDLTRPSYTLKKHRKTLL